MSEGVRRNMSKPYEKSNLPKALRDIKQGKLTISEAFKVYGVPKSTLRDKLKSATDENKLPGPTEVTIDVDGEKKMVEWIMHQSKHGFLIRKLGILNAGQELIKEDALQKFSFITGSPGQAWYNSFVKQHPEVSSKIAEGKNKVKTKRSTEESIRCWFHDLLVFLEETNNIDILCSADRIFNSDEIRFSVGPKTGEEFLTHSNQHPYHKNEATDNERENLTVLLTFNANGEVCNPLVVFPDMEPSKGIVDSIPPNWCLGKSETGWLHHDIFLEYIINDFDKWVVEKGIQKPILLLLETRKPYISIMLSTMCEAKGIILYAFALNAEHILQPADESIIEPLKQNWTRTIDFVTNEQNIDFVSKINFCELLKYNLDNMDMKTNIKNGFRRCGIFPIDPDAVNYEKCVQIPLRDY